MIRTSRFRYWLPLFPLLALLAFVYWLDMQVQQETAAAANLRHDPDVLVDNFHATSMDAQGVPRLFMDARQLRHYPDHDTTELEMPRMTMRNDQRPDVLMVAKRGEISSKGDVVIMRDAVSVDREASRSLSALALRTEYLRVQPNLDLADTDQAVTILNKRNTVQAIGLEMDNNVHTLKLLSHVRSEHLPNAK